MCVLQQTRTICVCTSVLVHCHDDIMMSMMPAIDILMICSRCFCGSNGNDLVAAIETAKAQGIGTRGIVLGTSRLRIPFSCEYALLSTIYRSLDVSGFLLYWSAHVLLSVWVGE